MPISGTEPSSVILSQSKLFKASAHSFKRLLHGF